MPITEIYKKYEIPPNLAEHQLTVAAVARNICALTNKGDLELVTTACLLHDMGNIIKFNLNANSPGLKLDNLDYWTKVQQKFIEKYGPDEHVATVAIAKELGVDEKVIEIIDSIGFTHSIATLSTNDLSKIISAYSDMRVAPLGLVSLEERLADLSKRYGDSEEGQKYKNAFHEMEKLIFSDTDFTPESITSELIEKTKSEQGRRVNS